MSNLIPNLHKFWGDRGMTEISIYMKKILNEMLINKNKYA